MLSIILQVFLDKLLSICDKENAKSYYRSIILKKWEFTKHNWFHKTYDIQLPKSFDSYLETLSSNRRQQIRRMLRNTSFSFSSWVSSIELVNHILDKNVISFNKRWYNSIFWSQNSKRIWIYRQSFINFAMMWKMKYIIIKVNWEEIWAILYLQENWQNVFLNWFFDNDKFELATKLTMSIYIKDSIEKWDEIIFWMWYNKGWYKESFWMKPMKTMKIRK